ncbi:MAG: transporter related protein [Geminicoccaceae bacterium]|jgi:ABC-2 type transport system ATP-binding protein|nr:transporter related protein [Geminicoccaceae bacterium]
MTTAAFRTDHLSRVFGNVRALDDLSLEVPVGAVFGLLGPNGAGKTTTIRLLLGLIEPTSGRAEVLGYDAATQGQQIRDRVGALLEHTGLYERLSAEDNLDYFASIWNLTGAAKRDRIEELLTHFGLWDRRNDRVGTWSRGMKQKLAIARAIVHRPPLVFLDEPTAGLDPAASVALREDIVTLARENGTTVFLTTHNLTEAERVCGLVAVIRGGKLAALGEPAQLRARAGRAVIKVTGAGFTADGVVEALRARPDVADVTVSDRVLEIVPNGTLETSALVPWLIGRGVTIDEVRRETASLEDVYLSLMEESQ